MRNRSLTALLVLPAIASAQSSGDDRWAFGTLRFGMSIEAAQTATPGTAWQVVEGASNPDRAYVIRASQLLDIGGVRYDVTIGSKYGGSHHWALDSATASVNAAECESRAVALITELERRFGAFDVTAPPIGTETVVSVGRQSKMKTDAASRNRGIPREQALKKDADLYFVRARHVPAADDDIEITVFADYRSARGRECDVRARLDGVTPPPAGLELSFDPARVIAGATISYRNRSLRDLGTPSQPLHFIVPCNLQASNGKIGSCINGPSGGPIDPHRKLASSWALKYQMDIGARDPADPTVYPIEIPISMSAVDVRDVDFENGTVLDAAQLKVVRGHRVDPADYFPDDPALRNVSADISVRCKVQEDGSLICGLKPGTTSPAEAFTRGAIRFAENLEVEPVLRDGQTAVGGFVDRRIQFRAAAAK